MRQRAREFWRPCGIAAVVAALLVAPAAARSAGWGQLRTSKGYVSVRVKPDARSLLVRELKPGTAIKVDFFKPGGWCALFDVSESTRSESKAIGYADCSRLVPAGGSAAVRPAASHAAVPHAAGGRLRQVTARVEVRRARNATSPVVAVLAPGERVQTGFARGGFVAVFRRNDPATRESTAIGYISEAATQIVGRAAIQAPAASTRQAVSRPALRSSGGSQVTQSVAPRQTSSPSHAAKQEPVRITSDRMIYNQAENSVVFLGNVHGVQGDMAIWANKITAYFTPKARAAIGGKAKPAPKTHAAGDRSGDFGDKIERIVAEGNVRMASGKDEGACGKLTYYVKEGLLRMDKNPILREGQNTIRGDIIKHYIHEDRSEVLSGSRRRVEAIFSQDNAGK